ncbi:MAG: hypothetical protein NTX79_00205 [Candidatus Micrarchaeota archaeon]|nr:hypothetical protein [Candidatus Micrarchaeota archaeon]
MLYPFGTCNPAVANKGALPAGNLKVVPRESKPYSVDWHIEPSNGKASVLTVVKSQDDGKQQASNPFIRKKAKEAPESHMASRFFG